MTYPETPQIFVVLYRWRLKPGMEAEFAAAWGTVTRALHGRGSLGARLHRGADGLWYSYAQWPSAEAREAAFAGPPVDPDAMLQMRAAIAESFPELVLELIGDELLRG